MTTPVSPLAQALEQRLSVARLRPYRQAVGGDLDRALELYSWNAVVAGAFFEDLGHLEVVLRNALHAQLEAWHARTGRSGEWYDDPSGVLDNHRRDDIAAARWRFARKHQVETPGKILAELNFGFWRFLLDKKYQTTLWAPALRHGFPFLTPRSRLLVYEPLDHLHRLRNRIAHHEPVHYLPLDDRHDDLLRVVGFIDPVVEAWLAGNSRVRRTLAAQP